MTPDFSSTFKNPFGDAKPVETKLTGLQRIIRDTIIFIFAAWVCGVFYMNGKEEGRDQTLREVSRIAEDHALLSKYLFDHGH